MSRNAIVFRIWERVVFQSIYRGSSVEVWWDWFRYNGTQKMRYAGDTHQDSRRLCTMATDTVAD